MQKNQEYILRDEKSFNKFCVKEHRAFNCKDTFGCTIACPLYRAKMVEYLVNEKGMTIGEAHRACIRKELSQDDVKECLRSMFDGGKENISLDSLIKIVEDNIEQKRNRRTEE